jgi:DNA repair protein RecO (recombination protein O)
MVYGLGKKNAAGKYIPFSLVQITADGHSVRTAALNYVSATLTTDPYKRTIALFLSEVLYHVLRHPMEDRQMWDYLAHAAEELDRTDDPQNFHIRFLIGFAARLGFAIPETFNYTPAPLTRKERQDSLRALCAYFEEHVETWQTPKSLDILTEVFD